MNQSNYIFKSLILIVVTLFLASAANAQSLNISILAMVKDVSKLYNRPEISNIDIMCKSTKYNGTIVALDIIQDKLETFEAEENTIGIEMPGRVVEV